MKNFNIGERVICIEPKGDLVLGREYEITKTRYGKHEAFVRVWIYDSNWDKIKESQEYFATRFKSIQSYKELI